MRILTGKHSWNILFFLFVIAGISLVIQVDQRIEQQTLKARNAKLHNYHQKAIASFNNGIDELAALVSGMRAFINNSEGVPDEKRFQQFLRDQLNQIHFQDSLIVSFVDTNQIFIFSLTKNSLNPNNLKGTAVGEIRSREEIERLEKMMASDDLLLFPPMNLIEGWVGIPLDFRVVKDGIVQGFIAPIINFKSIIDKVYQEFPANEFVFRFSTGNEIEFDRAAVYDGSDIYNEENDPESYRAFNIPKESFEYLSFEAYGRSFEIGIAYKQPYKRNLTATLFLYSLFSLLALILLFFMGLRILRYRNKVNTLLRKKNLELINYNTVINSFHNASSHDLKEPLRGIGSFVTLLRRRYEDKLDEKAHSYIDFIVKNVKQMYNVLDQTRYYTSILQNRSMQFEKVDLNILVKEVIEQISAISDQKKEVFQVQALPEIICEPEYIESLFSNLLENALKFCDPDKAKVEVTYLMEKGNHVFFIKDNGIGVPEAYTEKIFEPFQMLNKTEYQGVGMSLAACKKIVELHGGKIWVKPNKDAGSTFCFTIPETQERQN